MCLFSVACLPGQSLFTINVAFVLSQNFHLAPNVWMEVQTSTFEDVIGHIVSTQNLLQTVTLDANGIQASELFGYRLRLLVNIL